MGQIKITIYFNQRLMLFGLYRKFMAKKHKIEVISNKTELSREILIVRGSEENVLNFGRSMFGFLNFYSVKKVMFKHY